MSARSAAAIAALGPAGWAEVLAGGHAIDPEALVGVSFLGRSLGLPPVIERLTWSWFRKEIARDDGGLIRGWNVRVEQRAPHRPRLRAGRPWTFGHYEVVPLREGECPRPVGDGLLLDYGRGRNPALDPTGLVRDPIVAVTAGSIDVLLGWTYVRLLGRSIGTPSWFVLERAGTVDHVPPPPR